MARPQTDSGIGASPQSCRQSCRMEVWPSCNAHSSHRGCCRCCRWAVRSPAPALVPGHPHSGSVSDPPLSDALDHNTEWTSAELLADSEGATRRGTDGTGERASLQLPNHQRQHAVTPQGTFLSGAPLWEDEVSERVADQLRIIGDEMNSIFLQRRNALLPWQNWRGMCRALLLFITDTLCTLYHRRQT